MLRALRQTEIEGVATTIPADIAILEHPDFIAVEHSTRWVEDRLDLSEVAAPAPPGRDGRRGALSKRNVESKSTAAAPGRLWVPDGGPARSRAGAARLRRPAAPRPGRRPAPIGGGAGRGTLTVPMQGTIVKVLVSTGDAVEVSQASRPAKP